MNSSNFRFKRDEATKMFVIKLFEYVRSYPIISCWSHDEIKISLFSRVTLSSTFLRHITLRRTITAAVRVVAKEYPSHLAV
jgi:hypothetical protein